MTNLAAVAAFSLSDWLPADGSLMPALSHLLPDAVAIFGRKSTFDPHPSDLDLLAFGPAAELLVERRRPDADASPALDIIWLPAAWLNEPERLARYGLITHRLLSSDLLWAANAQPRTMQATVQHLFAEPDSRQARLTGFFDLAYLTVREIGVTWDYPPLALFWLQMAWAACLAALADGAGQLCPNLYTRPWPYMRVLGLPGSPLLEPEWTAAFHLDDDVPALIVLLRQVCVIVRRLCAEPVWPEVIRPGTRAEYRYWLDSAETEERIRVASDLAMQGDTAGAVWYLRFCAYSLARLPLVRQHALEGTPTAFGRPARAMRPALEQTCPEIVPIIGRILGGATPPTLDNLSHTLARLESLRRYAESRLAQAGFDLTHCPPWRPYLRP